MLTRRCSNLVNAAVFQVTPSTSALVVLGFFIQVCSRPLLLNCNACKLAVFPQLFSSITIVLISRVLLHTWFVSSALYARSGEGIVVRAGRRSNPTSLRSRRAAVNTAEGDNSPEHIADYFIQDGIPGWMRSEAEATLQSVYQAGDFTEKCPSFSGTSKGDLREHSDQCNNI